MSSVEELTIALEHDIDEQYQYQPGEVIRGEVRIKVARPTALRIVTIRVVGEGTVSWREEGEGSIHQADEKYLDASKVVLDTKDSQPHNLDPGYHEFSFEYLLPENLPSSYIGKFGNVTYTMKATVAGVKSIDTAITSEPFLILRRAVLPEQALQPAALSQEKRLWGSCTFGKISAQVSVEARGGVPGEDLFMHAQIKNHSQRTVTAMQASLVMLSTYHARKNTTHFRQVVSKKRDEFDVGHNLGRRWNYVRLTIPPYIPETHLDHCDIIEIDYFFQFRVEISGGAELKVELPFLIGSHLPGQESRRRPEGQQDSGSAMNRQWTVRAKGFPLEDLDGDHVPMDLGEPQQWGWSSGVPELRGPERAVMNNPLFRQGSFRNAREVKSVPEEQMENTRL
ncbi:arrestin domain-containing protein 4-like [Babylonia areolata]|uniref:arrestin domain-containing protein 4-like n=1 Tax=Babylonia areolata TaxID=304850 RepID=UPI003FD10138